MHDLSTDHQLSNPKELQRVMKLLGKVINSHERNRCCPFWGLVVNMGAIITRYLQCDLKTDRVVCIFS